MEPIILEVKNLRIYYETQESTVRALNGVDLVIRAGTSHGLVGETGAGKTILISAINAVLGARTSRSIIRSGESRAVVSALFAAEEIQAAAQDLRQAVEKMMEGGGEG